MRKFNLLGVRVCATGYAEALEAVRVAAVARSSFTVTALAVHGVMAGALDRRHRQRLNAFDMVVPAGQPVRWSLNLLFGARLRERVCGAKLMLQICGMCARQGLSVALYGNKRAVLDELSDKLLAAYPALQVAAVIPSRFGRISRGEQAILAERIGASGADVILLGLDCPWQEVWLFENRELLRMPIIAVGGAFDLYARQAKLAPAWMRSAGVEWLHRLWGQPPRLWRQALSLNALYVILLGFQRLRPRHFLDHDEPAGIPYEGHA